MRDCLNVFPARLSYKACDVVIGLAGVRLHFLQSLLVLLVEAVRAGPFVHEVVLLVVVVLALLEPLAVEPFAGFADFAKLAQ